MVSPVSLLSRLFAAKGNEIQTEMETFVSAGVVEPIAISGYAAPFKYIGNQSVINQATYDLAQTVVVPTLATGETYEVLIFSSANNLFRQGGEAEILVDGSQLLTAESPYGTYAILDVLDDSFSGVALTYRMQS